MLRKPSGTLPAPHREHRDDDTPLHGRAQGTPLVAPASRACPVRTWGEGGTVVRARAESVLPRQRIDVKVSVTHPTRLRGYAGRLCHL
jgi:hypothetical protein